MTSPIVSSNPGYNRAIIGHSVDLKVRFAELDPYGHVNHAVYFSYFEFGRTEALALCGLETDGIATAGFQLVVTQVGARFRRAAGPNDVLTVVTTVGELRRVSMILDQRITRTVVDDQGEHTPQELISAQITIGVTGVDGRPTRPPEWLFKKLAPLVVGELDA